MGAEPLRDRRRHRANEPAFWSYQSGSYEKRPDWVLPVPQGFRQENYLGMNASDYGGGTPVVDVWRRDVGLAVGHLELTPKNIFLPVSRQTSDRAATLGVRAALARTLAPGERFTTLKTFVAVHRGDYFPALVAYRQLMLRQGDPPADGAAQRVRADLVRVGLRAGIHDGPGPLDAAAGSHSSASAGPRSTTAGRSPRATGRRSREVSAGRRRT